MKFKIICLAILAGTLLFSACEEDPIPGPPGRDGQQGPAGRDGLDAEIYYSEWFSPGTWAGTSGDWYFDASAPDLTADVVESGVILAYVWLGDDIYEGKAVRPLPAYATGANWDFLIPDYGTIEFTSDMASTPATSTNKFRFIAIPGNIPALKSASIKDPKVQLKNMSYQEVCRLLNIPE